ncbi:MAG: S24 family peptidase [Porphyromonadaceae bacterium]|nr:S24 family peptidase [Porphyromonadaceae bacterium]
MWLLTGDGEMLKSEVGADDVLPRITDNPYEGRPYYDVDFLGGYGEQESETGVIPNYNIDYKPFNRDGVFYSNLYGDSMYPEFHSGAVLAMRPVEGWQDFLVLGKVYAIITTGGQRTVKQLAKGTDDDSYTLVPINPKYEAQPIPKRAILAVYEVLGGINRYE